MADSMQNFLGKHVEKIVLAAAIVIFALALTVFVAMRDAIFGDQNEVRTQVESLVKSLVEARKAPTLDKALTPEERIALGVDQAPPTGEEYVKQRDALPPNWDAAVDKWSEPRTKPRQEKIVVPEAPAIMPVADLQVFQGRGTTAETVPNAVFRLERPALADIVWAGVVGHLDLTDQLAAYNKAYAPLDPSGILVSKVEVQRQELKPDGTWSEWKPVAPALPAALTAKWPKMPANPRDKAAAGAWYVACKTLQADIRRMPLYALVGKDKQAQTADMVAGAISHVEQPEMKRPPPAAPPPTAPPAAPAAGAPPAPAPEAAPPATPEAPAAGTASFWATAAPSAPAQPTPGAQPVVAAPAGPKHVIATLWAYDASVEPGKTYRYQMRASVVNPIYGNQEVRDDKARWTLEFAGPWSAASREVDIPPLVEFFFIGMAGGDKVTLELHRWILSQWVIRPSVQSSLGAPVVFTKPQKLAIPGAKGAAGSKESMTAEAVTVDLSPQVLLVDVLRRFPYVPEGNVKPTPTNVLLFSDTRGQLDYRTDWDDKNAARAAKAEREAGGTGPVVTPPVGPTKPTPRPKPRPPTPAPKPPTPAPKPVPVR
jgi:hypothetical protein